MRDLSRSKVYLISDYSIEFEEMIIKVEEALKAGVNLLQYRDKNVSTRILLERGEKLFRICKKYNCTFIINDRVDIALALDADGVHLGNDDMQIERARSILGKDKIIGATAKTTERAIEAEKEGADYLGVGAIYNTSTKKDAKRITLEDLENIKSAVKIPVFAIGGINLGNLTDELVSKIDGVCAVGGILREDKVFESAKKFIKRF